jgi:hypothetical protein
MMHHLILDGVVSQTKHPLNLVQDFQILGLVWQPHFPKTLTVLLDPFILKKLEFT